jgi:hypothetical protein
MTGAEGIAQQGSTTEPKQFSLMIQTFREENTFHARTAFVHVLYSFNVECDGAAAAAT